MEPVCRSHKTFIIIRSYAYCNDFVGAQYRAVKDVEHVDVHNEGLALFLLTKAMCARFYVYYTTNNYDDDDDVEIP